LPHRNLDKQRPCTWGGYPAQLDVGPTIKAGCEVTEMSADWQNRMGTIRLSAMVAVLVVVGIILLLRH
jgi:hypothetical protein